jgi:hypothetical protein
MRVVGVHQPNFMPWQAFFDKMFACDDFFFLTQVQFVRRGFQNRTKVRTVNGEQWLTVPVLTKGKYFQSISDARIDNSRKWRYKHLRTIEYAYKRAPYFEKYWPTIKRIYSGDQEFLCTFNMEVMAFLIAALAPVGPKLHFDWSYHLGDDPTGRLINACKLARGDAYLSGRSGIKYMDESQFEKEKITIFEQNYEEREYPQQYKPFIPGMSVLDLLMNMGPYSRDFIIDTGVGYG